MTCIKSCCSFLNLRADNDNVPSQAEIEALRAAKGKAVATQELEESDDEDAELDFEVGLTISNGYA